MKKEVTHKKTCVNGHVFYKSGNCLVCPICEKMKYTQNTIFDGIVAPARRALENAGIKTIEDLSNKTKNEILSFHGIGPSSIPKLEKMLKDLKLNFLPEAK